MVIVYSPMKSGLLTGKMTKERAENLPENDWRSRASAFNEPQLSKNLELVELLREIGGRHDAGTVPPGSSVAVSVDCGSSRGTSSPGMCWAICMMM